MAADRSVIDAHHHVWDLDVRPQQWAAHLPALNRSFHFAELAPQLVRAGVSGTVVVETVNVPGETTELLSMAAVTPTVRGVVGWVDLTCPGLADTLAALQEGVGGEHLVAVRHQVQAEPDPSWLTRPEVVRGLRTVARAGLAFDLLVRRHQLPAAVAAIAQVPEGRFVLEHAGKPDIAAGRRQPWGQHLAEVAAHPQVACKVSGLVTEAAPHWSVRDLRPYAEDVLAAFGPERVMLGSDWPVCLLRGSYAEVWRAYEQLLGGVSADERSEVLGGSAQRWYRLP